MHTYISMLRGINVSGQKMIKMSDLKTLYESLHFSNVATYIQSGNVVFQSKSSNAVVIASSIENAIEKAYGFPVPTILRRPDDLRKVISKCPYRSSAGTDESRIYVTFLRSLPPPSLVKAIALIEVKTKDRYKISGDEVYLHCPNGYGKTVFSNNYFEKHLKVVATTRNWNTVQTLLAMSDVSEG